MPRDVATGGSPVAIVVFSAICDNIAERKVYSCRREQPELNSSERSSGPADGTGRRVTVCGACRGSAVAECRRAARTYEKGPDSRPFLFLCGQTGGQHPLEGCEVAFVVTGGSVAAATGPPVRFHR